MIIHTKYQGSGPCCFRQEEFIFSLYKPVKHVTPWGGPIFGPRGIIKTSSVEVHMMMLHTKYQDSRPCGFRQEDFFMFSLYNPM